MLNHSLVFAGHAGFRDSRGRSTGNRARFRVPGLSRRCRGVTE